MALANIIAAKKAGYTDQEIAEYLSQQSGADYTAAIEGGYSDKDIIKFLNTRDFGAGESFARGAELLDSFVEALTYCVKQVLM
jgi:hypothetical protein